LLEAEYTEARLAKVSEFSPSVKLCEVAPVAAKWRARILHNYLPLGEVGNKQAKHLI
jgi:hypothetical protein